MMLTRRFSLSSHQASTLARSFTTSALYRDNSYGRAPRLGDLTPDGADVFNQKQKEFRDGLEAAKKRKELADSQSPLASTRTSLSSSASDLGSATVESLGLGSLSIAPDTEEARQAETDTSTKRGSGGKLSSFIYGTPEGQQLDKDMERSFSQVLARGKYVHSIVIHEVKPDKVDEYTDLVGGWYPKMAAIPENKVHLVGSWRTEVGECETFGICISARHSSRANSYNSSYLGISTIHGLSCLLTQHLPSSRVPCL